MLLTSESARPKSSPSKTHGKTVTTAFRVPCYVIVSVRVCWYKNWLQNGISLIKMFSKERCTSDGYDQMIYCNM